MNVRRLILVGTVALLTAIAFSPSANALEVLGCQVKTSAPFLWC